MIGRVRRVQTNQRRVHISLVSSDPKKWSIFPSLTRSDTKTIIRCTKVERFFLSSNLLKMVESVDVFRAWGINVVENLAYNVPHKSMEIPSVYSKPNGPLPPVADIDPEYLRRHPKGPKVREVMRPYSVSLTDANDGKTMYLQILKIDANRNPDYAYYGWCCRGSNILTSNNFASSLPKAISWFKRKFLEVTGNDWSGRKTFVKLPNKMHLVIQETIGDHFPAQNSSRDLSPKRR